MGCAVEGVLARLRERVRPRLARLDRPGIPRPVVGADRVNELIVVGPANRRSGSDLDALRLECHRAHLCGTRGTRRPFAAAVLRRRLSSPPEVPAQRKGNRKFKPTAYSVEAA